MSEPALRVGWPRISCSCQRARSARRRPRNAARVCWRCLRSCLGAFLRRVATYALP